MSFGRRSLLALILINLLMITNALMGQTTTSGSICGRVFDPAHAAIQAAAVTLTSPESNIHVVIGSGSAGDFCFLQLAPAHYEVAIESAGFAVSRTAVLVEVGRVTPIAAVLSVAAMPEVVEVVEEIPSVNTSQPDFANNVDQEAIENLPINGRRWSNFALLTPGTSVDGDFGLISFRGVSGLLNNSTMDGSDNNQAFFGEERGRTRISYVISQSSVREFQVNASNFSAEYGRAAGAVINSVTKSGGNRMHGEAFYFIRDNALGAYNPFARLTTRDEFGNFVSEPVKPADRRQQFGGSLGGAIRKDRLFFFITWDQQKRNYPIVATAAQPALFDLPSTKEVSTIKALLPVAMRTDAAARTAFQQGLDYLSSLTGIAPRRADQVVIFPKIDYVITPDHKLTLSYNRMRWDAPGGAESRPVYNRGVSSFGSDNVHVDNATARLTSSFGRSTANDIRVLYSRDLEYQMAHAPGAQEPATGPFGNVPQIGVASASYGLTFGQPTTLSRFKYPDERRVQLADTLSYGHGIHLMKAGFDITRVSDEIDHLYQGGGAYSYSNRVNFIADYLQYINAAVPGFAKTNRGYSTYVQAFGQSARSFETRDFAYFLQDDWKLRSRLTVSLGLRYDRQSMPQPLMANPALPQTATVPSDGNNLGPRVGFAWDVFGDGNTAVRGGYGLYYGRVTNSIISSALMNTGVAAAQRSYLWRGGAVGEATVGAPLYPATFLPSLNDPALDAKSAVRPDIAYFDRNMQNPQIHQADLIVERQLTQQTMLSFSYLLSLGRELPNYSDTNLDPTSVVSAVDPMNPGKPNPANKGYTFSGGPYDNQTFYVPYFTARLNANFGQMTRISSNVNSRYDGVVVQLKRRFYKGFSYNLSYTWSRSTDTGQNSANFFTGNNTMYPGPFTYYLNHPVTVTRPDYGISNFEGRQKVVGSMFFLPRTFRHSSKAVKAIFDGWALSPVAHITSGRPYTEYISGTPAQIPASCDGCTGLFGTGGVQRLPFLPRNSHRFPSLYDLDLRASKRFYVGEQKYAEFSAEAFNVLNHTNVTDVSDSMYYFTGSTGTLLAEDSFGRATAAGNTVFRERQIQLAMRFRF
jgi:Carboxypeptidase regulatory-like domain/TonB dependent receptor